MDPEALRALVHKKVAWRCPPHLHDEVEADAWGALWQHMQAGKHVDWLEGLVTKIVRTCLSRLRRQQRRLSYLVPDSLGNLPHRAFDGFAATCTEEAAVLAHVLPRLRGRVQRWLLLQAIQQVSSIMMAEMLGCPLNEVHRQLKRLAARVRAVNSASDAAR